MAVTLIRRPIGHKLSETQLEGTIYDNGAGDAVVYVPGGHSLSDGDYVYVESDFDSYNGYKYVDAVSYDYFKIKNSEEGDPILWVQDAEVTMYVSALNHGWQGVHTPVVYELKSDIFPVNEAEEEYNPNVVDSFENYWGNVQLNLDHAISDPTALTWIELVGDGELAGNYQILAVLQPWSVVIDLGYDATYDFTGYVVVKHYKNYCINVNIYAGYESGHRWEARQPFELAGTLKLIPDANGVKFSIHEILRGYMKIRNNLTLDTLPNNTDFHISFYIGYSESYDDSDGGNITTFTSSETEDTFIGHAVNAMMPFKSEDGPFMSPYVSSGEFLARWLTLFDRPVAVVAYFFDLSFINQYSGINLLVLVNGELDQTITNPGSGVIRVPFEFDASGEHCVQVFSGGELVSVSFSGFTNAAGANEDWTLGSSPTVTLAFPLPPQSSNVLVDDYTFIPGVEYTVSADFASGASGNLSIRILNDSLTTVESDTTALIGGGTASITFTATTETTKIGFSATANGDVTLSNLTVQSTSQALTERICIDVIEECGETFNNELRITDGEDLRRV